MAERTRKNDAEQARNHAVDIRRERRNLRRQSTELTSPKTNSATKAKELTRFKRYALRHRPGEEITKEHALQIKKIVDHADYSSTNQHLPRNRETLTRFIFESPAEREYTRAYTFATKHGYKRKAMNIGLEVVRRFEPIDKFVAYEWSKVAGDPLVLHRLGTEIAREEERMADSYRINLISIQSGLTKTGRAAEIAAECGNEKLAVDIVTRAARRYDAYGDFHLDHPVLSVVGWHVGHIPAIRWAAAAGDKELATKIYDKVLVAYHDNALVVNPISFAVAHAFRDTLQKQIMGKILENRRAGARRRPSRAR